MLNSSDSSSGGNTKTPQISPSKRWIFTLNNHTKDEVDLIVPIFENKCCLFVIGNEVGELGTPHLQGYCEFNTKVRPKSVVVNDRLHWEKARGNRDSNITYCSKEKVLVSKGIPKPLKIITDLYPWQGQIEDLCKTEPDDRSIHWYYESEGCIGKSAFIKYMIVKYNVLFCSGGKHVDIMNLVFNQDMNRSNIVMFDIPRANEGRISYASLECIKNGMVCNTKYETGVKIFNSPHLIVFANFPPSDETLVSSDRWRITKL